jgi:hypothetical protein
MMKLLITTIISHGSLPQHKLVAIAEDGTEMDISGLVMRFTCDYPASELGIISVQICGLQVEHRTIKE